MPDIAKLSNLFEKLVKEESKEKEGDDKKEGDS